MSSKPSKQTSQAPQSGGQDSPKDEQKKSSQTGEQPKRQNTRKPRPKTSPRSAPKRGQAKGLAKQGEKQIVKPGTKQMTKQKAKPLAKTASKPAGRATAKSAGRTNTQKNAQPARKDTSTEKRLRVIPLGGLDAIGKNMTVFEYGDDMIVVDAGLMFPDENQLGIDLILPDYSYVIENEHKLKGIVITHGHEDHTGALPWLLKDLSRRSVPIITTKLTCGMIKGKFEEHGIKNAKFTEVSSKDHLKCGVFGLNFIDVNHSIPDAVAVLIQTPVGNVLHTGDFKFDQTPINGRVVDYSALVKAGDEGVMLLLSDSTCAERPGITPSEAEVGRSLRSIMAQAKQRIIIASFSSHIHRLQQICDAAIASGRKVAVTGRSMLRNTEIARKLGYLAIPDDMIIDAFNLRDYEPEDIVVLCTGSQGEPLSALSRMAIGEHRSIRVAAGDTVIFSATPVPGNEQAVNTVINQLVKCGAEVHEGRDAKVHVSGHAASEELKMLLNIIKPEYFLPVHGETRHLHAHKELALQVGIPEEYIFVLENGDVIEFDEDGAYQKEPVQNGVIYVDGLNVGDFDSVILRDRQHLSQDGIVTIVANVNRSRKQAMGDMEVIFRGVSVSDPEFFQSEIAERATKTLERNLREKATLNNARRSVKDAVSQLVWERTKTRPMVIPVIMEI
ncbi:MAG: RNase J family beta-CASP ribonuclease [Coriobacteriia bacterium]|nr:RNase J family beta-CASP ribonuclease [Coriobacteriia bacterium]